VETGSKFVGYIKKFYTQIQQNGIEPGRSRYEIEKIVAFNVQIFICVVVSFLFILVSLIYQFNLLILFSVTYLLLFSSCYYWIYKKRHSWATNLYLFTSNYSVFTISFCFGYDAGFYFYFLTTPLTVFISFDNSKRIYIYLALLSYLINALLLNYLTEFGLLKNPGILNDSEINVLFNINLFMSFFMIYMFMNSLSRINKLKNVEAQKLYQKQSLLEAQIHQKQLNETKVQFQYKKLESEYQQLDMFSHIISHNLRGPISRVTGILELLKPYPISSNDQEILMNHLHTSVLKIDEVIKDLNYILVQKKLGQESIIEISLDEILQEVKIHLSEEINESGALIYDKFNIERIRCIKGIMISIFYNLISNSIKYALPNQRPIIEIESNISDQRLELKFKDNGIGFDSAKYEDKLFRLYSRFHSHVAGKGMGLFLVKSHVDMLDGTVDVKSFPRKGTRFIIQIPLKDK